jgi:hypothetical protein
VKLVLVNNMGARRPAWLPAPNQPVPGLQRIAGDDTATLYRVVAKPAQTTTYALTGFNAPEGNPPHVLRWLRDNGATIELLSNCSPCRGSVSFFSGTFARPRQLTIRDQAGRVLYSGQVAGQGQRVSFPVSFSRRLVMSLSTDPPPEQVNLVVGGADTRMFGVYVAQPLRFVRAGG